MARRRGRPLAVPDNWQQRETLTVREVAAILRLTERTTQRLVAQGLMAAATDPIRDLAEAVAYWQEQAVLAAVERDKVREELTRVKAERDALLQDRATLEEI